MPPSTTSQPVSIEAHCQHAVTCEGGPSLHPRLLFSPGADGAPYDKPGQQHTEKPYFAAPLLSGRPGDTFAGSAIRVVANFFAMLFGGLAKTRVVEVTAKSCGSRLKTTPGTPNQDLTAAVVIFGRDEWEVALTLPGIGTWTAEQKTMWQRGAKTTSSQTTSQGVRTYSADGHTVKVEREKTTITTDHEAGTAGRGGYKEEQKTLRLPQSTIDVDTVKYTQGDGTSTAHSGGQIVDWGNPGALDPHAFVTLKISHNGQTFDFKEVKDFFAALMKLGETLNDLKNLQHKLPQYGFKLSVVFGLMSGKVSAKWGRKPGPSKAHPDTDRYRGTYPHFSMTFSVGILTLTIEGSLGFEWWPVEKGSRFQTGFQCTAALSLSLTVGVDFTIENFDTKTVNFDAVAEPKLTVTVAVYVLGIGAEAGVGLGGGLQCKGTLTWGFGEPPGFSGGLYLWPVQLKAYVKGPNGNYPMPAIELLPQQTLETW
jgi:hypothetical protein